MAQLKATEVLEKEHEVIQKVVAEMSLLADDLESNQQVEAELLHDLIEFMQIFVDKCHHQKEESLLFPLLEKKGVPSRGCPLAVLLAEHKKGRALLAELVVSCDKYVADAKSGRVPLIKVLRSIVELYPGHIWKENFMLFPMTDKMLSPAEHNVLCEEFENIESQLGSDVHEGFEKFAAKFDSLLQMTTTTQPHYLGSAAIHCDDRLE